MAMSAEVVDSSFLTERILARIPYSIYQGLTNQQRSAIQNAMLSASGQIANANAIDIRLKMGPVFLTLVAGRDRRRRGRDNRVGWKAFARRRGNLAFAVAFGLWCAALIGIGVMLA